LKLYFSPNPTLQKNRLAYGSRAGTAPKFYRVQVPDP
jgi:hypothetical protein